MERGASSNETAATFVTQSPVDSTTDLRLAGIEPLVVEANLAGYELTRVVAAGSATAPTLLIDIATYQLTTEGPGWNDSVPVTVSRGSTALAVGLHFEPRLAMRDEVGDDGSTLPSSYGIATTVPTASWTGSLSPTTGADRMVTRRRFDRLRPPFSSAPPALHPARRR